MSKTVEILEDNGKKTVFSRVKNGYLGWGATLAGLANRCINFGLCSCPPKRQFQETGDPPQAGQRGLLVFGLWHLGTWDADGRTPTYLRLGAVPLVAAMLTLLVFGCGSTPTEQTMGDPVARPVRSEIRAYHGAPPVIPHAVEALGRGNCISCHGPGQQTAGRVVAPVTPHPRWTQCNQCHVEKTTEALFVSNELASLEEPVRATMQNPFLPPYIPHRLDNDRDQSCETCHIGPQAPVAQRATHGPRTNCTQCHVPLHGSLEGYQAAVPGFP